MSRGNIGHVTCRVEAAPSNNVMFAWTMVKKTETVEEEEPIYFSGQVFSNSVSDGLISSFKFKPKVMTDYTTVTCRATNTVGTVSKPCITHLVIAGPPEPPTNCTSTPQDKDSDDTELLTVVVTCLEGFNGGFTQQFVLQAWQGNHIMANITT